jgi:DNA-directed RNA polymerase specialized sigma subunit
MSRLENSASIDHDHLETIAENLGVTSEFIKNFKEETAIYYIQNYHDTSTNSSEYNMSVVHHHPVDNLSELLQELIKDGQQKSQTLSDLSKAVLDLAEEVKKLQAAGK